MIKVTEKYFIRAGKLDYGAYTYETGERKDTKEPFTVEKLIGYHSSIGLCLKAIRNYDAHSAIKEDDYTLEEAIRKIEEIDAKFAGIIADFAKRS